MANTRHNRYSDSAPASDTPPTPPINCNSAKQSPVPVNPYPTEPPDADGDIFHEALSESAEKQLADVTALLCKDLINNECGGNITTIDDTAALIHFNLFIYFKHLLGQVFTPPSTKRLYDSTMALKSASHENNLQNNRQAKTQPPPPKENAPAPAAPQPFAIVNRAQAPPVPTPLIDVVPPGPVLTKRFPVDAAAEVVD